jgi:hypothetical protein
MECCLQIHVIDSESFLRMTNCQLSISGPSLSSPNMGGILHLQVIAHPAETHSHLELDNAFAWNPGTDIVHNPSFIPLHLSRTGPEQSWIV